MMVLRVCWYDLILISGDVSLVRHLFVSVGLLMGQTSDFRNCSRISLMYFCWERSIYPALQSHMMCIVRQAYATAVMLLGHVTGTWSLTHS